MRLRGVSVVRRGLRVLEAIDWEVERGSRWVVLGPNGSGKTTLLQIAGARLLPSSGVAEVLGERLGRVDMRILRQRVPFVSGALARQLRPSLSAREVVVTGRDGALDPLWRPVPAEDWAAADRMLARLLPAAEATGGVERPPAADTEVGAHDAEVGAHDAEVGAHDAEVGAHDADVGAHDADVGAQPGRMAIGERPFGVLSEGERQQVLIGRALLGPAELLLLDEPAAGLDLGARERLLARLEGLAADPDVPALVLVTHHVEEIPAAFTHAALLRDGRLIASGPLDSVLTGPGVSECFGVRVQVENRQRRWFAIADT